MNRPGEVLTARGGSLCFLQHVALCVKLIAAWYVPDVPKSVKNQFRERKHSNLRKELRWVMPRRCQGLLCSQAAQPPAGDLPRCRTPPLQSPTTRRTLVNTGHHWCEKRWGWELLPSGQLLHHLCRVASPPAFSPAPATWCLQQKTFFLR